MYLVAAVVQLIIAAGAKHLQTVGAQQMSRVAMDITEVEDDIQVERRTKPTHLRQRQGSEWGGGVFNQNQNESCFHLK